MNEQINHLFLLSPGSWLGEGTVRFSEVDEVLNFFSRWAVVHEDDCIECTQTVEMEGGHDRVTNQLSFSELSPRGFQIALENPMLGSVSGEGVLDNKVLAWEFQGSDQGFEGFEIYERQENDEYLLRAEYLSTDGTRTFIEGKLWKEEESCEA